MNSWQPNGVVTTKLTEGRLEVTVDSRWEGIKRDLTEFSVAPGDTFKVTGVFDKGNTAAAIRLYFQELDANGNHLSWNVINGDLQSGAFSHQHIVSVGSRLTFCIDKTNMHESDLTNFYVDEITITKE